MGGQACVFYGAAQVSKDIDFLVLAEADNFARLQAALETLQADRIAVPPFVRQPWPAGMRFTFAAAHQAQQVCGWTS